MERASDAVARGVRRRRERSARKGGSRLHAFFRLVGLAKDLLEPALLVLLVREGSYAEHFAGERLAVHAYDAREVPVDANDIARLRVKVVSREPASFGERSFRGGEVGADDRSAVRALFAVLGYPRGDLLWGGSGAGGQLDHPGDIPAGGVVFRRDAFELLQVLAKAFDPPSDRAGLLALRLGALAAAGELLEVPRLVGLVAPLAHGGVAAPERGAVVALGVVSDQDRLAHRDAGDLSVRASKGGGGRGLGLLRPILDRQNRVLWSRHRHTRLQLKRRSPTHGSRSR